MLQNNKLKIDKFKKYLNITYLKTLKTKYLEFRYAREIAVTTLVIVFLGSVGFFYFHARQAQVQGVSTNNKQAAQNEAKKIVAEVGKIIDLPSGEDPIVYTVTDITKLKDQPFFAKAKNGDKVLFYTKARKVILYSEENHKIIDVAPINIGSSSIQTATAAAKAKRK